jgi:hypothetical protein
MSYINTKIKNGESWGITHCELVLPASSLENMSAEEIGEQVLALLPYVKRLESYMYSGTGLGYFESIEEFEEAITNPPKVERYIPKEPVKRNGIVYLIAGGGYHKIGLTTNIEARFKDIGTKLPFTSEVIHTIRTSDIYRLEKYWHERFASKRAEGEWFILTDEDVAEFRSFEEMEV